MQEMMTHRMLFTSKKLSRVALHESQKSAESENDSLFHHFVCGEHK